MKQLMKLTMVPIVSLSIAVFGAGPSFAKISVLKPAKLTLSTAPAVQIKDIAKIADRNGEQPVPVDRSGNGEVSFREWVTLNYLLEDALGSAQGDENYRGFLDFNRDRIINSRDEALLISALPDKLASHPNRRLTVNAARVADMPNKDGVVTDLEIVGTYARLSKAAFSHEGDDRFDPVVDFYPDGVNDPADVSVFGVVSQLETFGPETIGTMGRVYLAADLNQDYRITTTEMTKLAWDLSKEVLRSINEENRHLDFNGDGKLDLFDVSAMNNFSRLVENHTELLW